MSDEHIPLRRHAISQVETYDVTPEELLSIKRECGNVGLDFQVALFFLTVGVSFLISILTTKIESQRTFELFALLVIVGFSMGGVFGIRWYRGRGSLAEVFRRIESRQVGPIGDASHQLAASQVAQLPAISAPPPLTDVAASMSDAVSTELRPAPAAESESSKP